MAKCTFCGRLIPQGTGKMYVKSDGRIYDFCSMKCEKNLIKLNRKPRETKWTVEYRKAKKEAGAARAATAHAAQPAKENSKEAPKQKKKQ